MNGLLNEELKRNYGVTEINPLSEGYHDEELQYISYHSLKNKKVINERLRLVTDSGYPYYDLSYWHVRIDGKRYEVVGSPLAQIPKRTAKTYIYNCLKKDGIFVKDIFGSISTLY